jgi:mannose-6-phosphate isomerase-like protein (cupin superfamily)
MIEITDLPSEYKTAPDGSRIYLLAEMSKGGLALCEILPGQVSLAHKHQAIEEIWYCIEGQGEVWRKRSDQEENPEPVLFRPGRSLTLPPGTHFQFRNTGDRPLRFLIVTMPPWPGPAEAVAVANYWDAI